MPDPDRHPARQRDGALETAVARALGGDRAALETVMRGVRPEVHALALRQLWNPQDAEDATQDILVRVLTGLGGFRGDSGFRTWVYRIACNALLTRHQARREHPTLSFDELGEDLARGLSGAALRADDEAEDHVLLTEIRIGCTLAMLQCLDDGHRLAYILGEILEFDHHEAARALSIATAAYRKRLSRARERLEAFMSAHCGLVEPANACRCHRRREAAVALGRVVPGALVFATSPEHASHFPRVLAEVRALEAGRRAAALYRAQPEAPASRAFADWLAGLLAVPTAPGPPR